MPGWHMPSQNPKSHAFFRVVVLKVDFRDLGLRVVVYLA